MRIQGMLAAPVVEVPGVDSRINATTAISLDTSHGIAQIETMRSLQLNFLYKASRISLLMTPISLHRLMGISPSHGSSWIPDLQ